MIADRDPHKTNRQKRRLGAAGAVPGQAQPAGAGRVSLLLSVQVVRIRRRCNGCAGRAGSQRDPGRPGPGGRSGLACSVEHGAGTTPRSPGWRLLHYHGILGPDHLLLLPLSWPSRPARAVLPVRFSRGLRRPRRPNFQGQGWRTGRSRPMRPPTWRRQPLRVLNDGTCRWSAVQAGWQPAVQARAS
eukprot:1085864-Prymnesium_polylepis.2